MSSLLDAISGKNKAREESEMISQTVPSKDEANNSDTGATSKETAEEPLSSDAQAGVQLMQAATTIWGKKHLYAAYGM